ncbi:MAG: hypothetical protein M1812_006173 [Candelaria pacifica]|nr:MAG: hypothetical protein M1812_006173 [Candelaria pacifica]
MARLPGNIARRLISPLRSRNSSASAYSNQLAATPIDSVLIANRGEIALYVEIWPFFLLETSSVNMAKTYPDSRSQHALSSPFSVNLGDAGAYLNGDRIIEIARHEGCKAIHPGYGFLSENSVFAKKCVEAGLIFVGPPWKAIEAMGNKSRSKDIMIAAGVPCVPGYHGMNQSPDTLKSEAEKIGFPVLLKAVRGGGGKGMRIAFTVDEFDDKLNSAKSEARNSFGDDIMLVEKYITTPRHIEVQVFADRHGNCVALGERDCSIQRRHQKILEESPAPGLQESVRQDLWEKARAAALAVGYEGAGTVEFIFDNETGQFFFMEMNTRLQVEHPVTEMITGEDLVRWQFMVAEGKELPLQQDDILANIRERGWAIEARIYAENPNMGFIPDSGRLVHLRNPTATDTVRIDAGFVANDEVSSHYDPMIAKLIVRGPTRYLAIQKLRMALEQYEIVGVITNVEFLKRICSSSAFLAGDVETGFIGKHSDELFAPEQTGDEVLAQAALGLLLQDIKRSRSNDLFGSPGLAVGFGPLYQEREFVFAEAPADSNAGSRESTVCVRQVKPDTFDVSAGHSKYAGIISHLEQSSNIVTSFFPHRRIETTVIRDDDLVYTFQRGKQYRLRCGTPKWFEKAFGVKDLTNSVVAPMPCKILRVDVSEGQEVKKDQALVVIESMKMETVIRSPHDGLVARIVHKKGASDPI